MSGKNHPKIFIFFFLILPFTYSDRVEKTKFLVDFINNQNCFTRLVILSCFEKDEIVKISRILTQNYIVASFLTSRNFIGALKFYDSKLTFWIDSECQNSKIILNQVFVNYQLFNQSYNWIIFENSHSNGSIIHQHYYFGLTSKIFLVDVENDTYKVDALFKYFNEDKTFTFNDVGLWSHDAGFFYFNKLSLPQNRSNLNGRILRISFIHTQNETLNHLTDYRPVALDKSTHVNYLLFETFASYLNATHRPRFHKFQVGELLDLTSGLLLALKNERIDVIGIPIYVTKERQNTFRYLVPTTPDEIRFVFKAPPLAYIQNVYTMPFYKSSWYSLGGVLIIATVVLYIMTLVYSKLTPDLEISLTFMDIVMIPCSALFQKSCGFEFKSTAGKIATGCIYITLMIITISYSANIVVYLQATANNINDFESLYDSNIGLGVENYTTNSIFYLKPRDKIDEPLRQKIYKERIAPQEGQETTFFLSVKEGIKKVQNEFFAFEVHVTDAYDIISKTFQEQEKCSLCMVKGFYSLEETYLLVSKSSSLYDLFKVGFRRMIEYGIQKREYNRFYHSKPDCGDLVVSNFSGTGIVETNFVFLIFILGVLFSLLILILEKGSYKYRNSINYYQHCKKMQPYIE